MIKAHYGDDRYGARYALFDSAAVEGFVPTSTLRGQVRDSEGRAHRRRERAHRRL